MSSQPVWTTSTLRELQPTFDTMHEAAEKLRDSAAGILCDRIRYHAELLIGLCHLQPASAAVLFEDTAFVPAMEASAEHCERITATSIAMATQPGPSQHTEKLRAHVHDLHEAYLVLRNSCRRAVKRARASGHQVDDLVSLGRRHDDDLEALAIMDNGPPGRIARLTRRAEEQAQQIDDMAAAGGAALSKTAEGTLAAHFTTHAAVERRTANLLLAAATTTLLGLAGAVLAVASYSEFTPASVAVKVLAGVPLAVLAYHLIKESADHRRTSRSADALAVRLRTIAAYVDLVPEDRRSLRHRFGLLVFLGRDPTAEKAAGLLDEPGESEPETTAEEGTRHAPLTDLADILHSVRALLERILDGRSSPP